MTKLIAAAILLLVIYLAYHLFLYWERVRDERDLQEAAAKAVVRPESLPGLPYQLEASLQAAQRQGVNVFRKWLELYGPMIEDPRKAWIELDYCLLLARDNPREARRVFAEVRKRIPTNSPVYPRIKQLEKTYAE
jgi:hypothetical protein